MEVLFSNEQAGTRGKLCFFFFPNVCGGASLPEKVEGLANRSVAAQLFDLIRTHMHDGGMG